MTAGTAVKTTWRAALGDYSYPNEAIVSSYTTVLVNYRIKTVAMGYCDKIL